MGNHITMCPYCKSLFDVEVGDKFKSGEIKERYNEDNSKNKNEMSKMRLRMGN